MLHPDQFPREPFIQQVITADKGPAVAATDYVKSYADQVRAHLKTPYRVLGTDGFGRSDSRANLRRHFEVDHKYIVVAALHELAQQDKVDPKVVVEAIHNFDIDPDKVNPLYA